MTLERDPNLAIVEAHLESSRGALLTAAGKFDPLLTDQVSESRGRLPLTPDSAFERQTVENDLGLTKLFRTGLSIQPAVSLLRTADTSVGPGTANAGTLALTLRQPLLRGRGRAATGAVELAAEREVTASGLDLLQATAERIEAVVTQYWSLEAAQAGLEILRDSEASSRILLETTRKLIEADVTPAAEIVQLEANLAAKEASRIGGELALFQSRQELGRQIGLDAAEIAALPPAADPFPGLPPASVPPGADARVLTADARALTALALARRADLRAARIRLEAADIAVRAAENALQPQLDLVLTPSYSGFAEGVGAGVFFSPLVRNVPGASVAAGFTLSWPTAGRAARGGLEQALAARRENALAVDLLAKGIGASIPAALEAVLRDAAQLDRAVIAVRLFERAVENEEKKLKAGTSTLLDVITQRDRLTAARQGEVSSQLALARALLDLRFATGTLVASGGAAARLGYADLTTLPTGAEAAP